MDLTPYVNELRRELAVAAEAGGEDARALAERLTAPLESAARLVLLDALSAAAAEITHDLAPGSVDVRLRGRDPAFVVTPPPPDRQFDEPAPAAEAGGAGGAPPEGEEGATARISFRLTEHLKARIEEAASLAGLSVNGWLVRAAAAALETGDAAFRSGRRAPGGGRRYTGWVR
jgi:hypothetical protein